MTNPEQLRTEIERTRAGLGGTVEALAAKTDVRTRARRAAVDLRERARRSPSVRRYGLPAAAAVLLAALAVVIVRRR
ncbi:DUF3618 domain-containing protein [Actinoplanes sp. NPDC049802]|uniref:DUF3618 domain-containing protein n=1 Tax=Actinoplanes sp. NPDC049802 TaxID=3154742 RepID=UPI00340E166F